MEDKYISLALHTDEHALALKKVLEAHGINVKLTRFVSEGSPIALGVKVMVQEKDIPLALKISESLEHLSTINPESVLSLQKDELLIPVDFNDYCICACKAGFEIADYLNLQPVILHAYPNQAFAPSLGMDDFIDSGINYNLEEEYTEIEITKDLQKSGKIKMKDLIGRLHEMQKKGELPDIKFKALLEDGVAEDVIKEYSKVSPPSLIVMVTRGKEKKGEQLIGSVTAEVLDDCKVPVLSIPENCNFTMVRQLKEVVYLCNMDQHDLICVDTFMRLFEYPEVTITLIPTIEKQGKNLKTKLIRLQDYFNKTYPTAHFITTIISEKSFMADFNNYESQRGTELIVVPNRRKNAIMRLFNPGLAHRLLFERDLPLLALPI